MDIFEKIQSTKTTKFLPQWNKGQSTARIEAFYGPWELLDNFLSSPQAKEAMKVHDVITIGVWNAPEGDPNRVVEEYWNPKGDKNFILKTNNANVNADLSDYATNDSVNEKVQAVVDGAGENYNTLKKLYTIMSGTNFELMSMVSRKADRSDVEDISSAIQNLASEEYVDNKISELVGSAPETLDTLYELSDALSKHKTEYGDLLDLVGSKATKQDIREYVDGIVGVHSAPAVGEDEDSEDYIPAQPATGLRAEIEEISKSVDELLAVDHSSFALKTDLVGLASEEFVANAIAEVDHSMYLTEHQDISNLAEKSSVEAIKEQIGSHTLDEQPATGLIAEIEEISKSVDELLAIDHTQFLTEHQSLDGYATEGYVDNKIADIINGASEDLDTLRELGEALNEHKDVYETLVSTLGNKVDIDEFDTLKETVEALSEIDHSVYATKTELAEAIDNIDIDSYAKKSDLEGLAKVTDIEEAIDNIDIDSYAKKSDLEGLAKVTDIEEAIDNIDYSDYATKVWVDENYLKEHQDISNLATKDELSVAVEGVEDWVNEQNYLKAHQDISNLATKDELSGAVEGVEDWVKEQNYLKAHQDISNLATKDFVNEAIAAVDHSIYLTKHQDISGKQNVISDLDSIREGAELGKTALQEHQSLEGYVPKSEYESLKSDYMSLCDKFYKMMEKMRAYDDKFGYISIDGDVQWSKDMLFPDDMDDTATFSVINGMGVASNLQTINDILADSEVHTAILRDDIEINKTIELNGGEPKTILLNGQSIKNGHQGMNGDTTWSSACDAITVSEGGTLTIKGEGTVETLSRTGSPVYAHGAGVTINIEDGFYLSNGLNPSNGWSLIYADGGAMVNISGGYFAVVGKTDEKLYEYVLNCKDGSGSVITVTGGYFYEANPSVHDHAEEVVIPEGYRVVQEDDVEYKGIRGTWYHVEPAE